MKRLIAIIVLFLALYGNSFSQTGRKLSESEKPAFEQKMVEQLKKVTTLESASLLEKTSPATAEKSVMKGTMQYMSPSKMRWEIQTPTISTLILNGPKSVLLDKNGEKIENEESKKLKQLGNFMIMMISGKAISQQSKMFSPEFYEIDAAQMLVILTPINSRMKEMFNTIELRIDQKTMLTNSITMHEKSGEKTVITLTNKVLNLTIPQDKFVIN